MSLSPQTSNRECTPEDSSCCREGGGRAELSPLGVHRHDVAVCVGRA